MLTISWCNALQKNVKICKKCRWILMTIGEKIEYYRKLCGLSQEQLAEKLAVSRQTIYKWEANLSCPKIEKLDKLIDLLGIDYNILLGKEDNLNE